jgi:hypothetical protein
MRRGVKEMIETKRTRLALTFFVALCLLAPTVSAKRKELVIIYTVPDFDDFVQYDYSEEMPNGFIKVDICYKFFWLDEDMNHLGYALQYIEGITKVGSGNDLSALHGYGVFYSEVDGKPGTITYKIGNIWKPNDPDDPFDDEFWGGHIKFYGGTDYYDGLKGQGELNFNIFAFELYLDYNPWE